MLDSSENRPELRPTFAWCYEPVHKSGPDVATNPKLKACKRPRKADC